MKKLYAVICLVLLPTIGFSQFVTKYPDIPRIDVHTHVNNKYKSISNYLVLRDILLSDYKIDLAMWIALGGEEAIDTISEVSNGRILTCISDYFPHKGLTHKPEDMALYLEKGYAGYKIWHGPASRKLKDGEEGIRYFDDPSHIPVLSAMEKAGMPGASVHIADPNGPFWDRGKWAVDPVEYWRQIIGLERVLQRHPDLVIVAAHGAWLVCQDAQIDFLRYLLSTYPNFHIDLAATFHYFYLVNHANLRDFIIEYSDRILYGTDIGRLDDESAIPDFAEKYSRTFQILETDQMVEGGFFGKSPVKGLNLPEEVLKKIYFENALKIYPGLAAGMASLEKRTSNGNK
jgi:hypothetical protein